MNPNKIYHSLHYLTMPFGFVAAYYIFNGTYYSNSIEDIGLGVLLLGIAYGFASMNDMTKFSKKEIAMFEDNKAYKKAINQILHMGIGMIITTITFISQRWLFPSKTGEAYFNLGLNCFPLIIAAFFSLKQLRDKKLYYDLEKDYYQATEQDFPHTIKNNDTSYSQGGKPHGRIGTFIGKLMNRFHTPYYRKYFKSITLNKNARILDIGCGGGSFLHYLNKRDSSFQLHGLDHSEEMISLASKKNRIAINKKQLELHEGSVSKLNLDNNSLDMITAFETIQFWPDHELAFHEIYRTLDNNGEFLVINRYPKEGTKWWDFAKLKTDKEYESALLKAHFQNVSTDLTSRKGWIIVRATKNDPLKTPEI